MTEAHAALSPSSGARWMNCTRSPELIRQMGKPDVSGEAALEGRAAHTVLETELINLLVPRGFRFEPSQIAKAFKELADLTEQAEYDLKAMQRDAQVACELVLTLIDNDPDAEVWVEQRVSMPYTTDAVWGTADIIVYLPQMKELWVVDYKYGRVLVPIEANEQLLLYLLCAMQSLRTQAKGIHQNILPNDVNKHIAIVQPRVQPTVSARLIEDEWLMLTFLQKLKSVLKAYGELNLTSSGYSEIPVLEPEYHFSEKTCRWCPALAACPEAKAKAVEACNFEPVGSIPRPDYDTLLPLLPVLKGFIAAVDEEAKAHLESGGTIEGWELVESLGNRKWTSEEAVLEFLRERQVPLKDCAPRKLLSPAQMSKLIKGTKKIASDELSMYISRPLGKPKLIKTQTVETTEG